MFSDIDGFPIWIRTQLPDPAPEGGVDFLVFPIVESSNTITGAGGIPSGEAFGSPTVSQKVGTIGIPSGEAFGAPGVELPVPTIGIASGEAFGLPTVTLGGAGVNLTGVGGIPSAEAFGLSDVRLQVAVPGIVSTESFGSATVVQVTAPSALTEKGNFMQFWNRFNGSKIVLSGYNGALAVTDENLAEHSTLMSYGAFSPAKVQISCANVADTAAGTGARSILIAGLDSNYKFITEILATNGQAYVESVNIFRRVFSVEVRTAGTGLVNAGIIYCIATGTGGALTGGVPATLTSQWVQVLAGLGVGVSGIYTVPAGMTAKVTKVTASGMAQPCVLNLVTFDATEAVMKRDHVFGIGTNQNIEIDLPKADTYTYAEKTDIYLRGLSTTAGGIMTAEVHIDL